MSLKFKTVNSDQPYYGLYQYSASFRLPECWVFRYTLDHADIDERLTRQQEWRIRMRQRWPSGYNSMARMDITTETRANVHAIADFICAIKHAYKLIIQNSTLRIYTNDVDLLYAVEQLDYVVNKRYNQVIVDRAKNTVQLKNPQHCYRSYFRETRISAEDKQALGKFLTGQPEIRIGSGLKSWLDETRAIYGTKYTRDYFFVDYNHENWLTMLSLIRPGLIRKTVEIVAK